MGGWPGLTTSERGRREERRERAERERGHRCLVSASLLARSHLMGVLVSKIPALKEEINKYI